MFREKIIKKLIKIIEDKGSNNFISSEDLKFNNDIDETEFINQIKNLNEFLEIRNETHIKYPLVKLTPKGVIFYKEYVHNFEEIYKNVSLMIKPMSSSFKISKELDIPKVFVDAIFIDLSDNDLIRIISNCGNLLVSKITKEGIEFFNNLNKDVVK